MGAGRIDPAVYFRKRRFAVVGRFVVFNIGQSERELILWNGNPAAFVAPYERDRFAPVSLTAEHPVAEFEVDLALADALFFEISNHLFLGFGNFKPVKETGIDEFACCDVGICRFLNVFTACNDFDDGQFKLLCKIKVALIVCRHCHNCAGTVSDEDIVGNEDRDLLTCHGIYRHDAVELHAGFVFDKLSTFKIAFFCRFITVCNNVSVVLYLFLMSFDERMFGCDYHVCRAEKSVTARCEDADLFADCGVEVNLRTVGSSDPVALRELDTFDIVYGVKVVDEPVRISGYFQHPLTFCLMDDIAVAALALTVDDFFVRKHDFAGGAPVDGHFLFICKPVFEELEEYPLCPFIIIGSRGIDLAIPRKRKTERLELLLEAGNVVFRYDCGMDFVFDRVVFGRKSECIPAHRE